MPFRSRSYGADQGCFYSQTVAGFEPLIPTLSGWF
jgi:hypothetical protein